MRTNKIIIFLLFFISVNCSKKSNPLNKGDEEKEVIKVTEPQLLKKDGKHPDWSPDGDWIAYAYYSGISTDIYMTRREEEITLQVTNGRTIEEHPFWSPDGKNIGFSSDMGENQRYNIFSVCLESKEITKITPDSIGVQAGDWSFDGKQIAFDGTSMTLHFNTISIIALSNGQIISLKPDLIYVGWPQFSPVDERIVFEALEKNSPGYNIWSIRADGSDLKQITTIGGEYPCWSPDGRWIAYSNKVNDNYDIYIIESEGGSSPIQVTASKDENEVRASWSTNGDFIVYDTMMGTKYITPKNAGIYLIEIEFLE